MAFIQLGHSRRSKCKPYADLPRRKLAQTFISKKKRGLHKEKKKDFIQVGPTRKTKYDPQEKLWPQRNGNQPRGTNNSKYKPSHMQTSIGEKLTNTQRGVYFSHIHAQIEVREDVCFSYMHAYIVVCVSAQTSIHFFLKSSPKFLCSGKTPGLFNNGPERGTP